jgi:putative hydrolase of the HAD superfamily
MIKGLIFDLDNTLYPASLGIEKKIFNRMMIYAAGYLGISIEEAERRRRAKPFGTTLEWLIFEHGLKDVEDYFAAVHPIGEEAELERDEVLVQTLSEIRLPKVILTNAPWEHAQRIIGKLGIAHAFVSIVDIRATQFHGKPHRGAYEMALRDLSCHPEEALFFDDSPAYVRGFRNLGGHGFLVDETGQNNKEDLPSVKSILECKKILEGFYVPSY